ncbi:hypothetical protein BKA62DRAFT_719360 [Auriculariales sp. MPI-PUGE-AT-0066]|nr:hypothetical protein BKA62DRAFT_719360 [Auriculariales sp. MPI-PUGE-AT-0066]
MAHVPGQKPRTYDRVPLSLVVKLYEPWPTSPEVLKSRPYLANSVGFASLPFTSEPVYWEGTRTADFTTTHVANIVARLTRVRHLKIVDGSDIVSPSSATEDMPELFRQLLRDGMRFDCLRELTLRWTRDAFDKNAASNQDTIHQSATGFLSMRSSCCTAELSYRMRDKGPTIPVDYSLLDLTSLSKLELVNAKQKGYTGAASGLPINVSVWDNVKAATILVTPVLLAARSQLDRRAHDQETFETRFYQILTADIVVRLSRSTRLRSLTVDTDALPVTADILDGLSSAVTLRELHLIYSYNYPKPIPDNVLTSILQGLTTRTLRLVRIELEISAYHSYPAGNHPTVAQTVAQLYNRISPACAQKRIRFRICPRVVSTL